MNGSTNGFMVEVYTNYTLAMCNKDSDNLRGPFTKALNLLYAREEDRIYHCINKLIVLTAEWLPWLQMG